ncbi:MAG TPA: TetR/AcrR family transcriptional regulator [Paludibacter sp.]|nr:TetR/AcrR family transcriptional regulator [Paludibacter sp.]HOS45714.1 TetR/AcrR family transcriptional regulator [Paludibacter sp.]HPM10011.1 TetR/AcrR family transcriptional regulator [Paludibacter sp.]
METLKENIIQTAGNQFQQMGIRNVSIDDVCAELRISKKTFYQYFSKKEDLVDAVIEHKRALSQAKLQKNIKDKNAIEIFVYMIKELKKSAECTPVLFWHDVEKFYPALFQKHNQIKQDNVRNIFENNIKQGIAEGYYRENLDIELLSFFHTVQIRNTFEMMMQMQLKFSLKRITDFFIDMIIRLVANEKGLRYIEENLTDKK